PYAWPSRRGATGTAARRSTTRLTRSVWPDSRGAVCPSWASWTRSSGFWRRRPISPHQVPSMMYSPRNRGPGVGPERALGVSARATGEGAYGVHRDRRLRCRHPGLGLPARGWAHGGGEGLRHEGPPLLRRLRADAVVVPPRRDRVRREGPATGRLRQ